MEHLRAEAKDIIKRRVRICIGAPERTAAQKAQIEDLFDLCLPRSGPREEANSIRRSELEVLLQGDVFSDEILWYLPDARVRLANENDLKEYFSDRLSRLLVPGPLPLFPRHRWTGADATLEWLLLTCVHNLMKAVVPGWLRRCGAGRKPTWKDRTKIDAWDRYEMQEDQIVLYEPSNLPDGVKFDWHEENAHQRGDALNWSRQDATPIRLVILSVVLAPLARLLAAELKIAGSAWDLEQAGAAAKGESRLYRLLEAYNETTLDTFRSGIQKRLFSTAEWKVLPPEGCTEAACCLAFRQLSRANAAMHLLLTMVRRGYPFKLISALLGAAARLAICEDFQCMWDSITELHLEKFPGAELGSEESLAIIETLALLMRSDISRIEARHASIRRQVVGNSVQVRRAGFRKASANFILQQRCRFNSATNGFHVPKIRKGRHGPRGPYRKRAKVVKGTKVAKKAKQKSAYRRGGGTGRVFIALRSAKSGKRGFQKWSSEYHGAMQDVEEATRLNALAKSATERARAGEAPIVGKSKKHTAEMQRALDSLAVAHIFRTFGAHHFGFDPEGRRAVAMVSQCDPWAPFCFLGGIFSKCRKSPFGRPPDKPARSTPLRTDEISVRLDM